MQSCYVFPVTFQPGTDFENPNLGEELLCRVTGLGPSFMGKTQVAIELIMPTPGFWGTGSTSKTPDLG